MSINPSPVSGPQLAPVWQNRFAFFSQYGLPTSTPQGREAFKALSFWERFRLNSNFLAFLFGPFYFMVKGMWRKGVALLVAALVVGTLISVLGLPSGVMRFTSLAFALAASMTANYAYFLHVTRGSTSWNPFEGFGSARRPQN